MIGEPCAIEMGPERSNESSSSRSHVVVTSVQTMSRPNRHQRFNPGSFGLLIFDEAHHSVAESYLRVLGHFRGNADLRILGVTATPDRADEEALGQVYEDVCFEYGIRDAINDGWLVPIQQRLVWVQGLDFAACKKTAGDLNQGDLAKIMGAERALHGVVVPTLEIAKERKTLFFTASVAQSERGCEIANRHHPDSANWICGETPIDERREILRQYALGNFPYLFNCAIALEGFDDPGIQVIAMARPTLSRALYAQAIGRGTRPLPGLVDEVSEPEQRKIVIQNSAKPGVLVLDYVGNSGRHKLVHATDVLGCDYDEQELADALEEIMQRSKRGEDTDVEQSFVMAAERREAARRQKEIADKKSAEEEREKMLRHNAAMRRQAIRPAVQYGSRTVDPFGVFDIHPQREPGWHKGRKPSVKMLGVLRKAKIPEPELEKLTFTAAKQLVAEVCRRWDKHLCSFAQAKLLKQFGYSGDETFEQANQLITQLKANGWRRKDAV
jgi:superfamily II DNA or RNA helicase